MPASSSCLASWLPNGTPVCNVAAYDLLGGAIVDGGQVAFVWSSFRGDLSQGEIRVRRMNLDGTSVPGWPSYGLSMADRRSFEPTYVCTDGDGGVIAVWAEEAAPAFTLWAQRMDRSGTIPAGWPSTGILVSTTMLEPIASIAPDGVGGVFIAWEDRRQGSQNSDVYIQRISSTGSISPGWPDGGLPVCIADGTQGRVQVSLDDQGGAFVAWSDRRLGSARVYASRITGSGSLAAGWVADGTPASTETSNQDDPQIVSDGSGGLLVAWDDWRPPIGTCCLGNVYAQHFKSDGSIHPGWDPAANRVCNGDGLQVVRSIVSDGAGGGFVAWMDYRKTSPPDMDIYATRINSDGTFAPGWPDTGLALCARPGPQFPGSMVSDGHGGFWVSWDETPPEPHAYDVYVKHVAPDGTPYGTSEGSPVCTASGSQSGEHLANVPGGGAMVAWVDGRTYEFVGDELLWGDSDIFATLVSDAGTPTYSARAPIAMRVVRPNPSPGKSEVLFDLERDGAVTCRIFDALGRKVRTLLDAASFSAGAHRALWDGKDDQGRHAPSGVYFIRVESGGASETRRLVRVRQ